MVSVEWNSLDTRPSTPRISFGGGRNETFETRKNKHPCGNECRVAVGAVFFTTIGLAGISHAAAAAQQKTFPSAESAVKAVIAAEKSNDDKELLAIFGPGAKELIFSGDAVADQQTARALSKSL